MLKGYFKFKNCIYIFAIFIMLILAKEHIYAYATSTISDDFPASYKSYIDAIKSKHPNWTLKAFYTHLNWNTVLNSEASGTYSRIQDSAFGDAWKRLDSKGSTSYNASGFVLASRAAVAYTLDPRNFLNDEYIFQFRVIDQNVSSDTEAAVLGVANGTLMGTSTYSSMIKKIGDAQNMSPVFVISRIRQETGCDIANNGSINGKNSKYPGYYNFFNIGARDGNGAVQVGVAYAYQQGWNNHEKALSGGVAWIKDHYAKWGQNTVYFQKFDVANQYGTAVTLLSLQYMSNITAPKSEASFAYNGLKRANTLNNKYTFYIPIYDGMPSVASPIPTIGYYQDDNTMVYLDDPDTNSSTDKFRIRSTADSSNNSNIVYELTQSSDLKKKTILRRVKKGIDTGWDYVEFEVDGKKIEGYVWNYYVFEYKYTKVTNVKLDKSNITLKVGNTDTLTATIEPENAEFKDVIWSSSANDIVQVEQNGKIRAMKAGTANITATTKDQSKTATCVVKVTDKDPSITLDKKEYIVLKDKTASYNVSINYTDILDYDVSIENQGIAKIQDGKILGVSKGDTKITATLKGTNFKAEATVKVIELGDDEIVIDESLNSENDKLSKIEPETKVKDIKEKIHSTHKVVIKDSNGKELKDDDLITTNSIVQIVDDESIVYEYNVIIYGDIYPDGRIDAKDYMMIKNYIMDEGKLIGLQFNAADNYNDNKIDAKDYMMIKNYIMNEGKIVQK